MAFSVPQLMPGIAGIVEIDLHVRLMIRDSLAGLGPVGVPGFMPQLSQAIRVVGILCSDVALDQLTVVQNLASERKLAARTQPRLHGAG